MLLKECACTTYCVCGNYRINSFDMFTRCVAVRKVHRMYYYYYVAVVVVGYHPSQFILSLFCGLQISEHPFTLIHFHCFFSSLSLPFSAGTMYLCIHLILRCLPFSDNFTAETQIFAYANLSSCIFISGSESGRFWCGINCMRFSRQMCGCVSIIYPKLNGSNGMTRERKMEWSELNGTHKKTAFPLKHQCFGEIQFQFKWAKKPYLYIADEWKGIRGKKENQIEFHFIVPLKWL